MSLPQSLHGMARAPIVRLLVLACTDFANYSADISVGGIGSPEGYTTTLIRTSSAQRLVNLAISQGYLEEIELPSALQKIVQMAKRKKIRGERTLAERRIARTRN